MIRKNYVVKGEDVDDYMAMENEAYLSYSLRLLYHFLFEKGYSREKLNTLKLGLKEGNHALTSYKNLMFTEQFSVEMYYFYTNEKLNIKSSFFNAKNELCTDLTLEVNCFDYNLGEVIAVPQQIMKHFYETPNSFL